MDNSSYQRGRVEVRRRRKGNVFTLVYWVRDSSTKTGWRLKRETLRECSGKRAAHRVLAKRISEVNDRNNGAAKPEHTLPKPEALTLKSFAEGPLWNAYLNKQKAKPSTRYSYESMLRNRILPKLGDIALDEISSQKLTVFFAGLESEDAVSPKYGINIFGLLSTMFDIAHLHHLIPSVPLNRKLHRGKNQRREKPRLSVDVLRGIVALAPAEYKVLFSIAISTGVRVGELIAFIWSDLNREKGTLSVTGSVWRGKRYSPKTSASIRTLRLSPGLIALLEHQLSRSEFRGPTDFIFSQPDGKPQDPDHLRRQVLYPILEQMGIERSDRAYGFHAFRHSAGSVLYKTTRDAKLVQSTLGHSNIQTTMDIYTHLDDEQIEEGTAILVKEILGEVCYPFVTQTSDAVN